MNDITVITPTIPGREDLVMECQQSVLDQTYQAKSHLLMRDLNRVGPVIIRNHLAAQADTEWIAFLDDDDVLLPHHFQTHSAHFDTADVIFSWTEICRERERPGDLYQASYNPTRMRAGHNSIPVTTTVRRSLFERVGGFPQVRFEDLGLWQRLMDINARFACVEEITWLYRVFPDGRNQVE